MRALLTVPALILIAACSGPDEPLENAAEQSGPAAAAVLENAAENGMNAQQALEAAGNAQVSQPGNVSAQARPNLPGSSNPQQPGQPPEKIVTNVQ